MFLRQFLSTQVDSKADAVTDVQGTYGTFHVKADGTFTYDLTADLDAGVTYTEVLRYYKISDGEGHTDTAKVTLNILGTDALPDASAFDPQQQISKTRRPPRNRRAFSYIRHSWRKAGDITLFS